MRLPGLAPKEASLTQSKPDTLYLGSLTQKQETLIVVLDHIAVIQVSQQPINKGNLDIANQLFLTASFEHIIGDEDG